MNVRYVHEKQNKATYKWKVCNMSMWYVYKECMYVYSMWIVLWCKSMWIDVINDYIILCNTMLCEYSMRIYAMYEWGMKDKCYIGMYYMSSLYDDKL